MNRIKGHIKTIEVSGSLSMVSVDIGHKIVLKSIVIETPETAHYLIEKNRVFLLFKETEVIITNSLTVETSVENNIPAQITELEIGKLLCRVVLQAKFGVVSSIISTNAFKRLNLKVNDNVRVLIKMNEIMLSE